MNDNLKSPQGSHVIPLVLPAPVPVLGEAPPVTGFDDDAGPQL